MKMRLLANPVEIMEPFSPDQVPILSTLARHYAISDAWFCSGSGSPRL
jgi:phospholipase C